MATLDDIRAKLPSLRGLSDEQALQYLQQRYTPDVPVATIARNLGMSVPEPVAPPAPKRSLFAVANDTVIEAANAAAGTAGSIANFVSPGNRFSQGVDEFIKQGEASQSDAVNQDRNRFRERMESAQGVGDELAAVGGYIMDSPLQALAQAAGSIAVPGAAMKVAGALGGGVKTGLGIGAAIGASGAGGDAAGTAYELAKEAGATDEEATAAARSASVIPAIVGGVGGVVGAERLLAGAKGFGGGAVSRALKTAGVEGAQEGIEEGITQYEGQRAAVPFDPTIDPMKGVAGAAAMGVALGGATGGGVSLLSPAPAPDAPPPDKKAEADAALTALGSAGTVDEAVALATKATDIPVLPTRNPNSAKMVKARNAGTLAWVRDLERDDQTAALGLMAVLGNPRTPETVRRSVSAQLDALERKAGTIPTGEASEVLPTGDVFDDQDIPTGEATELRAGMAIDGQNFYDPDLTWEQRRERLRRAAGLGPAMEATELLPTGEATEADPIPAGESFEDIPTADAAEVLPVGDAADMLPTGEVIEEPEALPTGEATDIEPDQADTDLLLTGDGMPYGTRSAAYVRAKREGLPPDAVVDVPGGWAVKKESQGERGQPDVAGTAGVPASAGAGRAPDAVGSGVAVGRVAADAGGLEPSPATGVVAGSGQADPAGSGAQPDPALSVEALSKQWADAVARGDGKEAQRLNVAITKLNEAARRAAAGQDRNGLTAQDRAAGALGSAASELSSQIQGDIAENDFDPDEVMPGLRLFAEQAKVPADELRQEVLKRLRASGMKRGDLKRVERAMDPTTRQAPEPATRADGRTIPQAGDDVFTYGAGMGGSRSVVTGTVVQGRNGLSVSIKAGSGLMGERLAARTVALSPEWTLSGEEHPDDRQRRESAEKIEADSRQRKEARERTLNEAAERNGTLDPKTVNVGDVLLMPDGSEQTIDSISEKGEIYASADGNGGRYIGSDMRGIKVLRRAAPAPEPAPAPQVSTWTPEPAETRFDVPNPPTWNYRLKERGGTTYMVPPVGQAFTLETRRALRDWANAAGFFSTITGDNEVSIAQVTGGPSLDYVVDGVKEQAAGRRADAERAAAQAPAPAPTNPPAPAAQTRPERLIELRKRQSVLKQLLECLG